MPASRSRLWLLLPLAAVLAGAGGGTVYLRGAAAAEARRVAESAAIQTHLAGDVPASVPAALRTPLHPATVAFYDGDAGLRWTDDRQTAALGLLGRVAHWGIAGDAADLDAARVPEPSDADRAALDIALTSRLLRFGDALAGPTVDAAVLYGTLWEPHRRPGDPAAALFEALDTMDLGRDAGGALAAFARALSPGHPEAQRLQRALARELTLADRPDLALARDLAPGDAGPDVVRLRERLAFETEAAGLGDAFDEGVADALRTVQTRDSLAVTGRLDADTRRALNTRRPDLVPALTLNLERWRWLPDDLGALHVFVNIPDFEIVLREDGADAFRSVAAVGKAGWNTNVFSDTMETVVFNPTWTIPASIQRESYGRVRGYMVKPPGPGNPMGRVKFLYPNGHAIYIHDTTAKWGFEREDRALSHGCVRVADPRDLATEILTRVADGWDADRVAGIFEGPWSRTQTVTLRRPVPIHHVYLTVRVDADGRVRQLDDVYGYDARLAEELGLPAPTDA